MFYGDQRLKNNPRKLQTGYTFFYILVFYKKVLVSIRNLKFVVSKKGPQQKL